MTDHADKNFTQHFLPVVSKSDRGLAEVMFNKRPGLKHVFETCFEIAFPPRTAYGDKIFFTGSMEAAENARKAFAALSGIYSQGGYINKDIIKGVANDMAPKEFHNEAAAGSDLSQNFQRNAANQNVNAGGTKTGAFAPKNEGQATFAKEIADHDLTFGIGSAGTGKTHVAVAMAYQAFKEGKVKKIFLARPAKESGESIGFIPGTADDKLAPYMRPIYDEMDKIWGRGKWESLRANGTIEIAPIGFMRGRTFSDAFIILDEAQNTTVEQMRMALTRIGENSKMVVTGDESQVDLENPDNSGLMYAVTRLEGANGVGVHRFAPADVVRSKIVMTVVERLGAENTALKPRPFEAAPATPAAPVAAAPTTPEEAPKAPAPSEKPKQNQQCKNPRW